MGGVIDSPSIKAINKGVVHRICSGQVILDLSSAVKELVENSLDAGASCIEISLKEHGAESFKVSDNGCGISPSNFQALALKHHTSKIADIPDLQSLTTFGFRGEALSSLCALGNLIIETRTKNEPVGTRLIFEHSGAPKSETKTARQIGTTVTVEKLFSTLPVRSKEFNRNIRREYGKLISLLNSYAVISKGVRLVCSNVVGKGSKSVVLKTQGSSSLKDNIISVFGLNTFACLEPLDLSISNNCKVEGFISKTGNGNGRNLGDRQFFYVNGRPVDMPKVGKLVNELYRCSNSKQHPIAIMDFLVSIETYDVNVTPDKRKIFLSDEGSIMLSLREAIGRIYSPTECSFPVNKIEDAEGQANDSDSDASPEYGEPQPIFSEGNRPKDETCSFQFTVHCNSPLVEHAHNDIAHKEKSSGGRDDFESEDLTLGVHKTARCDISSPCLDEEVSNPSIPHNGIFEENLSFRRSRKKEKLEKAVVTCRSKIVQSSLTKFVTVKKRERDDDCSILSEMPVLRNERKTYQANNTSTAPNLSTRVPETLIDSYAADKNEALEDSSNICRSNDVDNQDIDINLCDKESELGHDGNPSPSGMGTPSRVKSLGHLSMQLESGSSMKPCVNLSTYPMLQFNIDNLRNRRCQKISSLHPTVATKGTMRIRRCYAAATLDTSQMECHEEKEKSLAAATTELERFFSKQDFKKMKVIGQFNLGFIIGKLDEDLFIIDQHAADEKYNFEQLSQSTILNQQPLLRPMRLELSPEEEVIVSMHMEIIRRNGFCLTEDIHESPGHRFLLKSVPFSKNITFGVQDIKELISAIVDSQGECSVISSYRSDTSDSLCPSRVRAMLASRACRSSVMIGDPLAHSEMKKILKNLSTLRSPWNCPHGRPTMRHLVDLADIHNESKMNVL